MAIRTKKYRFRAGGERGVRAIRITDKNIHELVDYIKKNGGSAFVTTTRGRDGEMRLRIKQRNYGENWGKVDWRVARVGDFIIRHDFPNGEFHREPGSIEFARVKDDTFEATFELV